MGTRYYYRAYLRESNGKTMRLGRVMYFTTQTCSVNTTEAAPVSIFSATMHGQSSIKLNDRYFTKSSLNTQGVGIIMKKDFRNIIDLFGKKKKKKK